MTGVAIALAALAAVCFACAATLQHRAVGTVTPAGPRAAMTPRRLSALVGKPGWLAGLALGVAGGGLHLLALVLAPVSVVQPVGALAVPIAVLLAMRLTRRRPSRGVLIGVALTIAGVAVFVVVAADSAASGPVPTEPLLTVGAGAAVLVAALVGLAWARPGWVRNMACATAAAVAFGFESVLLRAMARLVAEGPVAGPSIGTEGPLAGPSIGPAGASVTVPMLLAITGVVVALLVGGWLVQQAFAAGPPEPVVACLTVVDPIVAVGLAMVLLGEGARTAPGTALILGACAAVATAGVLILARYHPDAAQRRQLPERTPDERDADHDRSRYLPA